MAQELVDKIRAAAQARGIDPELALSIARAESSLDPRAKARTSSASGLFQVTKDTWKEYGGKPGKQMDPDENIRVGLDIIAKNTNLLKTALNRDPRPAEVYAAHYFGPTGAKSFLTADPATPIAKVLGEKAVKANPNLQGKTAGQVLAQLEGKVGGAPATAAVSRETSPASAPTRTPAEEIVEPALRSGMTAQAPAAQKLAALGPGYQAALALSFLSDEDEKEGRDPDTGPSVAEQWLAQTQSRPAALALSDISVKSPFAALEPQPAQPVRMAKGGEVEEPSLFAVPDYAETVAYEMYPGQKGQFTQQDAARHMLAAGTLARKYGPTAAEMLGKLHEIKTSPLRWVGSKLGIAEMPVDYEQDLYNNQLGIEAARRSKSQKELEDLVQSMAEQAKEQRTEGKPWIGRPVRRADGSPKEGEVAEPTAEELAAASKPAFLTPKSGIGRKISTKPGELEAAALQGVSETPYNVLGAPVDLVTMAMRPFGYDVKAPVGGSEWLKQQASRAGVRQEPPSGAAARALYELGQLGGSSVNPAAPVRRAAQAAEAVQESGKAAQILEGMKNLPVGASVKPVEPFFQHIPSAEAPFVGRLDEFVAGMQAPVRKDQFLGQLKGKFRDYDIARAESALKGLDPGAKLTPSDLLNRLKTRYDPASIRTTVHEPRETGFWHDQDNPYQDRPVGVIHMSSFVSPEQAQRMEQLNKLDSQLFRAGDVSYNSTARLPELDFLRTDPIGNTQVAKLEEFRQYLIDHSAPLFEAKRLMNEYMFPAATPTYTKLMKDRALWEEALARAKREGVPDNQQITQANEWVMDTIRQPAMQKMEQMLGTVPRNEAQLVDAVRAKQGALWDDQRKSLAQDIAGMAQDMRRYFAGNAEKYGMEKPYKGKDIHFGLEPPVNAAGFTRFVPQTVQDPDRGPMQGIHLLEIQSDLTSELKAGEKMGLKSKEVFPNMAENRRLVQQLGMKNAIAAAINRGDQFVTFPGKESKKPHLYEGVRDNLKAVAKDLGPGFEIRPFTFTSPEKGEIQHWGITWGPDAGKRIQQKGVPFKDGGAVERNTADHRKYL